MTTKIGERLFALTAKATEDAKRAKAARVEKVAKDSVRFLDETVRGLERFLVAAAESGAVLLDTFGHLTEFENERLVEAVMAVDETYGESYVRDRYRLEITPYTHAQEYQRACQISWEFAAVDF